MMNHMLNGLLASIALSIACAALSVFVVSRRWAFIGEGISHSGFGGAGTAWMLRCCFRLHRAALHRDLRDRVSAC
jgi:ABC-type Mn2+/Zn2+ transport system permease subunit